LSTWLTLLPERIRIFFASSICRLRCCQITWQGDYLLQSQDGQPPWPACNCAHIQRCRNGCSVHRKLCCVQRVVSGCGCTCLALAQEVSEMLSTIVIAPSRQQHAVCSACCVQGACTKNTAATSHRFGCALLQDAPPSPRLGLHELGLWRQVANVCGLCRTSVLGHCASPTALDGAAANALGRSDSTPSCPLPVRSSV
jgi:hypothetical protein